MDWDVIVVGAGPAGSAAAISAARLSLRVLLVDAKPFPRRKVCGGCLNQVSIALAKQLLGTEHPLWSSALALGGFRLHHAGRNFEFPLPAGLAIDRMLFDQRLVDQCCHEGVIFADSTTAKLGKASTQWREVQLSSAVRTQSIRAKAVVLAGGLGSRAVDEDFSLMASASTGSRVGVEALFDVYPIEYAPGSIHMAVGSAGYVGLTQLADRRLHVAAAVERRVLQRLGPAGCVRSILEQSGAPLLPDRPTLAWRGTPPLTCRARQLAGDRVFLVGDAAGYVEPFTGEGIRWALETGMAVAPLLLSASQAWDARLSHEWTHWYRTHIGVQQRCCRRIAFGLKHATTRWLAHRLLQFRPQWAQHFIARLNDSR
ncbi:MAG: FAD-dependent monooxygenase [Planctomycetales bacterium]|nr:FAD-dependent monooxygenase [Planctomycetales bacterium]